MAQPQIIWEQTKGGSDMDFSVMVALAKDGNWLFSASSASTDGDLPGNAGGFDTWVFKSDTTGSIIWSANIGGASHEEGGFIAENPDGSIWVVGETHSSDGIFSANKGKWDCYVVKLSASGERLLTKTFGGVGADDISNMAPTPDGGLIFSASTWSPSGSGDVAFNHGNRDCWLVKLDAHADIEWQRSLGGSAHESGLVYASVGGGYWVLVRSKSNDGDFPVLDGDSDHWLLRVDPSGNVIWKQRVGLPEEVSMAIAAEDPEGNIAVMLRFTPNGRMALVQYAPDGTLRSNTDISHIFSPGSYWTSFQHADDAGFYFYGVDDEENCFLARTDALAQMHWRTVLPTSGYNLITKVMPLSDSELLVLGSSAAGFDPDQDGDVWMVKLGGVSTSEEVVSQQTGLLVYPNPVAEGQPIHILLENNYVGPITFELLGIHGRSLAVLEREKTQQAAVFLLENTFGRGPCIIRFFDGQRWVVQLLQIH